jgi:hypothetical protein
MKLVILFICSIFTVKSFAYNYYASKVSDQYLSNICVTFAHQVSSTWYDQLMIAIDNYNSNFKGKTKLGFCSYPYSSDPLSTPTAIIEIELIDDENLEWDGNAQLPSKWTGKPGKVIVINQAHLYKLMYDERVALIMHEIGHTIGLEHTDSGVGIKIPGTDSLQKSLFREQTGDNSYKNPVFSTFDIKAIEYLYK